MLNSGWEESFHLKIHWFGSSTMDYSRKVLSHPLRMSAEGFSTKHPSTKWNSHLILLGLRKLKEDWNPEKCCFSSNMLKICSVGCNPKMRLSLKTQSIHLNCTINSHSITLVKPSPLSWGYTIKSWVLSSLNYYVLVSMWTVILHFPLNSIFTSTQDV